ncbi:MAG: hypothetical protein J5879_04495 [Clostridia bacterium]|nr:hypothetical protein [Clostridia bacterium]
MKDLSFGLLYGVDALGRATPTDECSAPRKNRQVGIFYFLWCGEHGRHAPLDITKIIAKYPDAGKRFDVWGDIGQMHHWGEPFYGYYYSDDEWVIRKHMKLLMQADIDFLFFDTTNAVIYEQNAKKVMKVLQEYHDQGFRIPRVMFYTNTQSGKTVQKIYDAIYKQDYCPDTWYVFDKKPLIIAIEEECSKECREFFDIKKSQWPNEPDKVGGWPWMDFVRPQRVFKNEKGEDEVINVSVAQHPQIMFGDSVLYGETANRGRAFHNGENDKTEGAINYGYNFSEQFDRAVEADPPVVLVTGWNEWIAGRWQGTPERPIRFVDLCNCEYSRDLEMMKGGYFDNYYMLLVSYVRKYKGFAAVPVHKDGEAAYYPSTDDGAFERDNDGYGTHYSNHTGRNAITGVTVTKNGGGISFKVEAKDELIGGEGDFMAVFVQTEKGRFVLEDGALYSLDDKFVREKIRSVRSEISDRSVTYELPVSYLTDKDTVYFKAADSKNKYVRVEDFYDNGDTAPLGRLDFIFRFEV